MYLLNALTSESDLIQVNLHVVQISVNINQARYLSRVVSLNLACTQYVVSDCTHYTDNPQDGDKSPIGSRDSSPNRQNGNTSTGANNGNGTSNDTNGSTADDRKRERKQREEVNI